MTTRKSGAKKSGAGKKSKKSSAKPSQRKRPAARKGSKECGEFHFYTEGSKKLVIEIIGNTDDASVSIQGDGGCRTLAPCRIVNGQWEC